MQVLVTMVETRQVDNTRKKSQIPSFPIFPLFISKLQNIDCSTFKFKNIQTENWQLVHDYQEIKQIGSSLKLMINLVRITLWT